MTRHHPSRGGQHGQSAIEFLFIIMFFMMLVGFVRTFVYFELDVFNNTNKARYDTLHYIRNSFGQEDQQSRQDLSNGFQDIATTGLRPIPFLKYLGGGTASQYRLTTRRLNWQAGTVGEGCKATLGCDQLARIGYVAMTGFTASP